MSRLTFATQLSLDFIFGNIKELPRLGEEVLSAYFDIQLGGGTLVYPIVLSRLGVECRVIVKKADSIQSDLAYTLLQKHGIHEIITISADDYDPVMATAVISLEKDRSFISHNDSRAFQFEDDFLLEHFQDSPVVFAMEQNERIIPPLKEQDHTIVFDVGWAEDLSIRKYAHILKYVDYFTPNEKEAMKMTATHTVQESLRVLQQYVKYPIVSCGKDGCVTIENDNILHVKAPQGIHVVDTTGAGDNFMAGLVYGIYHGLPIRECMKFANCTGALSTTQPGCYGAEYTLADIQECLKQIPHQ
jgi:sugar/nucleoside kinase (ribokinase family)